MAQPPGYNPLPEYDALRRRLQGQYAQKRQESQDAIQRRFAANGMLNSGAYGKAQQKADMDVAREQSDAESQLGFAEAQEAQRRTEVAEGRAYQTKEREASQAFTKGMFDVEQAFKERVFGDESAARWKQLELAGKEFDESKKANDFNKNMAQYEAGFGQGGDYDQFLYRTYGPSYREILGMAPPSVAQPAQAPAAPPSNAQTMQSNGFKWVANPGDPRGGMWVRR